MNQIKFIVFVIVICVGFVGKVHASDKKQSQTNVVEILPATIESAAKTAKKFAERLNFALELSKLLINEKADGLKVKSDGSSPEVLGSYFGVTFKVTNVTAANSYVDTILGYEVPGRRVTVTVTVDCIVECKIDCGNIKCFWSKDEPRTLVITIPPIEIAASIPPGQEYSYMVEYGFARVRWLEGDKARNLCTEILLGMGSVAADNFKKGNVYAAFQKGIREEVRKFVTPLCPKDTKVEVIFKEK